MSVNRLPVEVLCRCFRLASVGPSFLIRDPSRRREVVRCVCHFWRDVVDGDPQAWSYIVVDNYTPLIDLHCWLTKSRAIDLSFEIICLNRFPRQIGRFPTKSLRDYMEWLFDTITPFLPRCRALRLRTSDEQSTVALLRRLSSLSCDLVVHLEMELVSPSLHAQRLPSNFPHHRSIPLICQGSLPSLTAISFKHNLPVWKWTSSFSSLTTIRLMHMTGTSAPSIKEVHGLLRATPSLASLTLHFVDCSFHKPSRARLLRDSPVLPHLTHIDFALLSGHCAWLLASLRVPALRTLALEIWDEIDISFFVGCCEPVLSSVTTLVLAAQLSAYHQLAQLLLAMPALVRLDGRGGMSFFVEAFHGLSLHWENLCPALTHIVFSGASIPIVSDILFERNPSNFAPSLHLIAPVVVDDPFPFHALVEHSPSGLNGVIVSERLMDSLDYFDIPCL